MNPKRNNSFLARFPLYQSPIDQAHHLWEKIIRPGDLVIDATCGNGHDTLFLSRIALTPHSGTLYAIDNQLESINSCRRHLEKELPQDLFQRIHFIEGCHSKFPSKINPGEVALIVYNLGYLPGGDKSKVTQSGTTIKSLQEAMLLIKFGGVISITCYPGHPEGQVEENDLLQFTEALDPGVWSCSHQRWINRKKSPSLLIIQKRIS